MVESSCTIVVPRFLVSSESFAIGLLTGEILSPGELGRVAAGREGPLPEQSLSLDVSNI